MHYSWTIVPASLSARRAWIEIIDDLEPSSTRKVALRKESVDRNTIPENPMIRVDKSLSARRAWIEISGGACARPLAAWSLSARRAWIEIGLNFARKIRPVSLSARRAWIEIAPRWRV